MKTRFIHWFNIHVKLLLPITG